MGLGSLLHRLGSFSLFLGLALPGRLDHYLLLKTHLVGLSALCLFRSLLVLRLLFAQLIELHGSRSSVGLFSAAEYIVPAVSLEFCLFGLGDRIEYLHCYLCAVVSTHGLFVLFVGRLFLLCLGCSLCLDRLFLLDLGSSLCLNRFLFFCLGSSLCLSRLLLLCLGCSLYLNRFLFLCLGSSLCLNRLLLPVLGCSLCLNRLFLLCLGSSLCLNRLFLLVLGCSLCLNRLFLLCLESSLCLNRLLLLDLGSSLCLDGLLLLDIGAAASLHGSYLYYLALPRRFALHGTLFEFPRTVRTSLICISIIKMLFGTPCHFHFVITPTVFIWILFLTENEFNTIIIAFHRRKINKLSRSAPKFVKNNRITDLYGLQMRIFRLPDGFDLDKMHKAKNPQFLTNCG